MKKILPLLLFSLASSVSFASVNCQSHIEESTKTVYYIPAYEAKATYYFDTEEKNAFATVSWKHNEDATKSCFSTLKESYPSYEFHQAQVRLDTLAVRVFKGTNTQELILFPEVGGHFNGTTDKITVDYSARNEIKKAIQQGKEMISISGDFSYRISTSQRGIISEIPCLAESEVNGVMALHKRLGQVIKLINGRASEEKISRESILDQFMTSCVSFEEMDASSFSEVGTSLLKKTRLIEGKIPMYGTKKVEKSLQAETISLQESSVLDY